MCRLVSQKTNPGAMSRQTRTTSSHAITIFWCQVHVPYIVFSDIPLSEWKLHHGVWVPLHCNSWTAQWSCSSRLGSFSPIALLWFSVMAHTSFVWLSNALDRGTSYKKTLNWSNCFIDCVALDWSNWRRKPQLPSPTNNQSWTLYKHKWEVNW